MNKTIKKIDVIILSLSPIIAALVSVLLKTNFLISTFLFLGIPSLYLSIRTKKAIGRAAIFALLFITVGSILDHLAVINSIWFVPTIFPFRIFGTVPAEDYVWAFMLVYLIIIYYEHFLDKGKHKLIAPHMKYFCISYNFNFYSFLFDNFT